MPWEYLEEEAIADIGIKVTSTELNTLFEDSVLSICNLMTDLKTFNADLEKTENFEDKSVEMLLYQVLEEVVYLKDAELFFVKSNKVRVSPDNDHFIATVTFVGGRFDPSIHEIGNDIKAITLHDFYVKNTKDGFEAHFIIDI